VKLPRDPRGNLFAGIVQGRQKYRAAQTLP